MHHKKHIFLICIVAFIVSHNGVAHMTTSLFHVAERFRPVFVINSTCPYDLPQTVNFDDDWDVLNNERNYSRELQRTNYQNEVNDAQSLQQLLTKGGRITPEVYYEVIESESHYFMTYYLFYPHDAGDNCAFLPRNPNGGHQNDATSMMMIVRKNESGGTIEYVLNNPHLGISDDTPDKVKMQDGRPMLIVSSGNHTAASAKPDEQIPTAGALLALGTDVPYALHHIYDELWPERHNLQVFGTFDGTIDFETYRRKSRTTNDIADAMIGVRYRWNGIGKNRPPWAPWARGFSTTTFDLEDVRGRGLALSFIDPIKAFADLYRGQTGYSTTYVTNPYLPKP